MYTSGHKRDVLSVGDIACASDGFPPDTSSAHASEEREHAELRAGLARIAAQPCGGLLRRCHLVELPANRPGWTDTGIELRPGDWITTLAVGRAHLSRRLDLWIGARFQLWLRVGPAGAIFRGSRDTHSFLAHESGNLHFACHPPEASADEEAALVASTGACRRITGRFSVVVILWNAPTLKGLRCITGIGSAQSLIDGEVDRIRNPVEPPPGWRYDRAVGPSEAFRACSAHGRIDAIRCVTRGDAAILRKDTRLLLSEDLRLQWEWRVDQLPSGKREDRLPAHDYFGVGIEFDNRRVLTYIWSAALPLDFCFRSPMRARCEREAHLVVRSGEARLGRWLHQERSVQGDYVRSFPGSPLPERIVGVRLVACSLFQRQEGRAHFASIALLAGGRVLRVH